MAAQGNVKVLQWAYAWGMPVRPTVNVRAAESGSMETLAWVHSVRPFVRVMDRSRTRRKFKEEHKGELLPYIDDSKQIEAGEGAVARAAFAGHIHILEWFTKPSTKNWRDGLWAAVLAGRIEVLRWAEDKGVKFDPGWCTYATEHAFNGPHWDVLRFLLKRIHPPLSGMDNFWMHWARRQNDIPDDIKEYCKPYWSTYTY